MKTKFCDNCSRFYPRVKFADGEHDVCFPEDDGFLVDRESTIKHLSNWSYEVTHFANRIAGGFYNPDFCLYKFERELFNENPFLR